MNLVNKLQTHYAWTPSSRLVSKKPAPMESDFEVPQSSGKAGWIILGYDNNIPVCLWVTTHETRTLTVCLDERLFGDSIFRAEYIDGTYIISDVYVYNSCCVFNITTFKQRYEWLSSLLGRFAYDGLKHKSAAEFPIKGYEVYDSKEGSHGCFIEDVQTVIRTDIPDVYTIKDKEGYLLVPTLKLSVFLRSKGAEFKLRCSEKNGKWEYIP